MEVEEYLYINWQMKITPIVAVESKINHQFPQSQFSNTDFISCHSSGTMKPTKITKKNKKKDQEKKEKEK